MAIFFYIVKNRKEREQWRKLKSRYPVRRPNNMLYYRKSLGVVFMTDVQFQQLLEAINNMNNGIPTWLSLLLGSILGIFSNISFDMYQNYKRKSRYIVNQSK